MKQFNIQKALKLMAALSILLALSVISITIYILAVRLEGTLEAELYSLPAVSMLSFTIAIFTILLLRPVAVNSIKQKQTEASLDDLNKLNNTLRAQRHDFMNHLQVVHSLIELKEYSDANEYIDKVYSNIEKVCSILKTGIPAVNAILEAKRRAAENRGIEVTVEVNTTLSELPVPDWEFCKLLGNIIDNSINALSDSQTSSSRFMNIEIFEDIHSYKLKISNNGPVIPQELWDRIFEAGFTTRIQDGEGMGLAICREIISRYNGKIWVISDEYETVFEAFIPRVVDKVQSDRTQGSFFW